MKDSFSLPKSKPEEHMPRNSQDVRISRKAYRCPICNAIFEDPLDALNHQLSLGHKLEDFAS